MDTNSVKSDSSSGDDLRKPKPPVSAAHLETATFDADAIARQTHSESTGAVPAKSEGVPAKLGRFRVKKLLGRGGMGSVYLAHDEQLDRPVALKVPRATDDDSSNLMPRFFREARAAATLSHPNICPIYDVGCEGNTHFIAMGFIEGRPLSAYADAARRQPERQVALVVRKIALALQDAHEKGIVHRDLKPANIMIDRRGEPIVMDFGLAARLDDRWETRLTRDGSVIGTPAYMSPEQIDGRTDVGPAADIYSLGVVFYELLTGQCPYSGNVVSVIGQVLHTEPRAIADLRPDVTPALAEICARAMAKEPRDRYGSMKELAQALTGFLKGDGSGDSITSLSPRTTNDGDGGLEALLSASMSAATAPPARFPAPASRRKQQRTIWIVGGIGTMVVLVLLGLVIAMTRSGAGDKGPQLAAVGAVTDVKSSATDSAVSGEESRPALPPETPRQIRTSAPPAVPSTETPKTAPAQAPDESQTPAVDEPVPPNDSPAEDESPLTPDQPSDRTPTSPSRDASPSTSASDLPQRVPPTEPQPNRPMPAPNEPVPPPGEQGGGPPGGHQFSGIFGIQPPGTKAEKVTADSLPGHFNQADRNHDGRLDPGEIPMHIVRRADLNHDDALTGDELKKAFKKMGQSLFGEPRAAEQRKLPAGPGFGPGGGPGPGPKGKMPRPR